MKEEEADDSSSPLFLLNTHVLADSFQPGFRLFLYYLRASKALLRLRGSDASCNSYDERHILIEGRRRVGNLVLIRLRDGGLLLSRFADGERVLRYRFDGRQHGVSWRRLMGGRREGREREREPHSVTRESGGKVQICFKSSSFLAHKEKEGFLLSFFFTLLSNHHQLPPKKRVLPPSFPSTNPTKPLRPPCSPPRCCLSPLFSSFPSRPSPVPSPASTLEQELPSLPSRSKFR